VLAKRLLPFVITVLVVGGLLPAPSFAAQAVVDSYSTWQRAAMAVDSKGVLYQPTFRAGLKQDSRIDVLAFKRKTKSGSAVKYSAMLITASYTGRLGSFSVMEKYADTKWAARRIADLGQRVVAEPILKMNGSKSKVRVRIYANCAIAELDSTVEPKSRCSKADVKSFGGLLVMTAPGKTSIIIESERLSYGQLVAIARGLKPLEVGN
jgi:hypothetical protein